MTTTHRSLTCGLVVLVAAGCSTPNEPARTSTVASTVLSPPAVASPVSINAEMVTLVDHAAHQLWNAEKAEMAPKTDADWENIVEHATQIAATGALIRLAGTGPSDKMFVQNPEWHKFAAATSAAGVAAIKAGQAKDQQALVAANGQLVDACEGCHKQFKPAIPTEGITHTHAR